MAKEVAKQVSLSNEMWGQVQSRIKLMGVGFPEYIRHLILKDTEPIREKAFYMSDDLAERVQEAREEIKKGKYTTLKSKEEIEEYVKSLK